MGFWAGVVQAVKDVDVLKEKEQARKDRQEQLDLSNKRYETEWAYKVGRDKRSDTDKTRTRVEAAHREVSGTPGMVPYGAGYIPESQLGADGKPLPNASIVIVKDDGSLTNERVSTSSLPTPTGGPAVGGNVGGDTGSPVSTSSTTAVMEPGLVPNTRDAARPAYGELPDQNTIVSEAPLVPNLKPLSADEKIAVVQWGHEVENTMANEFGEEGAPPYVAAFITRLNETPRVGIDIWKDATSLREQGLAWDDIVTLYDVNIDSPEGREYLEGLEPGNMNTTRALLANSQRKYDAVSFTRDDPKDFIPMTMEQSNAQMDKMGQTFAARGLKGFNAPDNGTSTATTTALDKLQDPSPTVRLQGVRELIELNPPFQEDFDDPTSPYYNFDKNLNAPSILGMKPSEVPSRSDTTTPTGAGDGPGAKGPAGGAVGVAEVPKPVAPLEIASKDIEAAQEAITVDDAGMKVTSGGTTYTVTVMPDGAVKFVDDQGRTVGAPEPTYQEGMHKEGERLGQEAIEAEGQKLGDALLDPNLTEEERERLVAEFAERYGEGAAVRALQAMTDKSGFNERAIGTVGFSNPRGPGRELDADNLIGHNPGQTPLDDRVKSERTSESFEKTEGLPQGTREGRDLDADNLIGHSPGQTPLDDRIKSERISEGYEKSKGLEEGVKRLKEMILDEGTTEESLEAYYKELQDKYGEEAAVSAFERATDLAMRTSR